MKGLVRRFGRMRQLMGRNLNWDGGLRGIRDLPRAGEIFHEKDGLEGRSGC